MIKRIIVNLAKHAYLVMGAGVLFSFILIKNMSKAITFEMVAIVAILYCLSAFVHHLHDKTLTFEIVVEYILLAGLMLVILVSFFV